MKTKSSKRASRRNDLQQSCWFLGTALVVTGALAQDADVELRNWVDFSVGGNLVHGDKGAFQQRAQQPRDLFGGISDFHYEADVGKKGLFEVDGRGIYDDNYSIELSIKDPDRGYVRFGYEQFKSYYDGSGGFFPLGTNHWVMPTKQVMEVDRGRAFFEAGLTLEDKPQVRLRYQYDFRDGEKNSTSWGDTVNATAIGTRKIIPGFYKLDEDRHSIALDVEHTIKSTQVGIGGRAEFSAYDNGRYMRRNYRESRARPAPQPRESFDRWISHREGLDTDLYNVHFFTATDITERWKVTTGYSYTQLDTDLSGERFIGRGPDDRFDRIRQVRDHGFIDLAGGTRVDQHVGTISAMWRPTDHLTVVPSLRIENMDQNGFTSFVDEETGGTATGALPRPIVRDEVLNTRSRETLDITESLEARYTGVTNVVLYARGEWLQGEGDISETEEFIEEDGVEVQIDRMTESTRFTQKYVTGANWYPHRKVAVATQYYHRIRENEYDHIRDSVDTEPRPGPAPGGNNNSGDLYPAFITSQGFTTDDVNFRVTLKPLSNLSFVTRYDFQITTIDSEMKRRAEVESANSTAHIITESITWSPLARLYLQASGSYTFDELESPADFILPRVQVSENHYWTASGTIGFALTDKTDLTANYSYFLADNYDPSISNTGLAFGVGLEEHTIGGSVVHRFSKRMQLVTRYTFLTSEDETAGGFNDYDAHLLSSTLRFRF
jgi:hypothetical protein